MEWDEDTSLFQNEEYNDFFRDVISHRCFNKTECELNLAFFT